MSRDSGGTQICGGSAGFRPLSHRRYQFRTADSLLLVHRRIFGVPGQVRATLNPVSWPKACSTEVVAMLVPAIVEVLAGLVIVWVAILSWEGRLPRNGAVGVRTPSTMRSDAAFAAANKAAAPLAGAGGAVAAVCGVLAAVFPRHLAAIFIFTGMGVLLVLVLLGAAIGVRAARSVP